MDGNKYAVSGTARDGSGLPLKVGRRMAGGYILGHVHVEDRILEGGFLERDLKYVSEVDFQELVKKQNRIAGGKKANAKRNSDKRPIPVSPGISKVDSGSDSVLGTRGQRNTGGTFPAANPGEPLGDPIIRPTGADVEIVIDPSRT